MKKKFIAAAIVGLAAVPALAQTKVTISGRVAGGWESYKLSDCNKGAPLASCDSESRVSDQSSRIIFNVTEDLGGGLSAWATLESRFAVDGGSAGWNAGNGGIGLMHKQWGKFTIGHWDLHYNEFGAIEKNRAGSNQTKFGDGIMSQVSSTHTGGAGTEVQTNIAGGSRTPNVLMWDSPNWNGLTARLAYSTSTSANEGSGLNPAGTGNPGGGSAWTAALRYNNGPWTAGASYWDADSESRTTGTRVADQSSWRAWLGYKFSMGLNVGFGWDHSEFDNSINGAASTVAAGKTRRDAWMIPVSYSFGAHTLYARYARAGSASGSAIASGTGGDFKAHAWHLGYDYALSKRTSAGVYYTELSNNSNSAGTVGSAYNLFSLSGSGATPTRRGMDVRQWYFGMAHNF